MAPVKEDGTIVFLDTSHGNPSMLPKESGEDLLRQKIHEAAKGEHDEEQRLHEEEAKKKREKIKLERENAERALAEFFGFDHAKVEFRGATKHGADYWSFRVGTLVFKLNRITANGAINDHGKHLSRRDFSFEVCSEYERVYGNRRLLNEAEERGDSEYQKWNWNPIKSLAEIPELQREGKLEWR